MNRDQDLEMAVENATYKVQNTSTTEHFERLEICNGKSAGEIYTLREYVACNIYFLRSSFVCIVMVRRYTVSTSHA